MTDNEIIRSLEGCMKQVSNCCQCIYSDNTDLEFDCEEALGRDIVSLINRQKAEIERLTKTISDREYSCGELTSALQIANELLKTEKSEAIKEFAEQLRKRFYFINGHCVVDIPQIGNLVKK